MLVEHLKSIKVIPIAEESFGVRSMCTYVETPDVKILIDPGVSLGQRFALLPHVREYKAIKEYREKIVAFADKAEVLTISHYHFDHYTPTFTDFTWSWSSLDMARQIYQDKIVLAKAIRSNINISQRRRGWMLQKTAGGFMKRVEDADGKSFSFGDTHLSFSKPVFHGEEDIPLGWVLMLNVEYEDEKVVHASDVQGPVLNSTLEMILSEKPQLVCIGGPPLYLVDFRVSQQTLEEGIENLSRLAESIPITLIEHHLLRDQGWREFSKPVFDATEKAKHLALTAAEFLGKPNNFLEYRRRELYRESPPNEEFIKWTKLPRMKQKQEPPPL